MVKPKADSIWKIGKQYIVIKAILDETICFIRLAVDESGRLAATPDKNVIKGTLVHKMRWSVLQNRARYFASNISKANQKLRKGNEHAKKTKGADS